MLSFVRAFGDDVVLCVNNLSRFPQPVELDLRQFEGYTPVELTGRVEFPQIGVLPYMLTLAGHGFYWFELSKPHRSRRRRARGLGEREAPVCRRRLAPGGRAWCSAAEETARATAHTDPEDDR